MKKRKVFERGIETNVCDLENEKFDELGGLNASIYIKSKQVY